MTKGRTENLIVFYRQLKPLIEENPLPRKDIQEKLASLGSLTTIIDWMKALVAEGYLVIEDDKYTIGLPFDEESFRAKMNRRKAEDTEVLRPQNLCSVCHRDGVLAMWGGNLYCLDHRPKEIASQ